MIALDTERSIDRADFRALGRRIAQGLGQLLPAAFADEIAQGLQFKALVLARPMENAPERRCA